MPRVFIPAQDAKTVPVVRPGRYADGQTYLKGAVLGLNAGGELVELATDPAANTIAAVALERAGSKPGNNVANDNQVVFRTGVAQETSVVDLMKQPDQIFSGRLTNAAGVDQPITQTLIGETRNLLRLASGEWVVEDTTSVADAVMIVDIVLNEGAAAAGNYVLFQFLPGFVIPV